MRPWPKRLPGAKAPQRTQKTQPLGALPAVGARVLQGVAAKATRVGCSRKRKQAAAPSSLPLPAKKKHRTSASQPSSEVEVDVVARRLAAGRTSTNYWWLMDTSLLSCALEPAATLPAVRGLTASWQGTDVWILDSFTRRGCGKTDVAELKPSSKAGEWVLGQVSTCSTSDLELVRLQHEVVELKAGRVVLRELRPSADPVRAVHSIREKADAVADAVAPSEPAFFSLKTEAINCYAVKPEGALAHEKMHPTHVVSRRSDRKRYEFCFDVPHVQVWDMTPWRCRNCASETWHVTSSDIDAECTRLGIGRVILGKDPRHGKLHATPMMLFWLLLIFYSKLNLRAVRRSMLDLYSATVLHAARASPALADVVQLRWILMSLPATQAIKNLLLHYFAGFVQKRVDIMQRRQFVYNGQIIRGDGNYSLSKSVYSMVDGAKVRKFTVALAWCGVDGSLLAPVSLAAGESWPCIQADLKPLLQKIKQTRLEAGFSLEESLPCFHATDSYHKHRIKISKLYGKVWQDLRVQDKGSPAHHAEMRSVGWTCLLKMLVVCVGSFV